MGGYTYAHIRQVLDEAAKEVGVQPPSAFEYEDPKFYAEIFEDDVPSEIAARLQEQREWHDAGVGLETFKGLLDYFRLHEEKSAPKGVEPGALLYELDAFHFVLQEAARRKDLFRIETDV